MLSRSSILGWAAMALLAFGCSKSSDHGTTQAPPAAASNPASTAPGRPVARCESGGHQLSRGDSQRR